MKFYVFHSVPIIELPIIESHIGRITKSHIEFCILPRCFLKLVKSRLRGTATFSLSLLELI